MRQKVKEMVEFVQDDDRLREERKKPKKNKDKYIGVSSDSMGGGGGSFKNCKTLTEFFQQINSNKTDDAVKMCKLSKNVLNGSKN